MENIKEENVREKGLKNQLFGSWTKFERNYVLILLALQLIAFALAPDGFLGLIMGVTGVLSVVYGMKARRINFLFGLVQCSLWAYTAFQSGVMGQFYVALFYLATIPFGWVMWGNDEATKTLKKSVRYIVFGLSIVAFIAMWVIFWKNGTWIQTMTDSLAFSVNIVAQLLYILKYKENWTLWIYTNIANVLVWVIILIGILNGTDTSVTLNIALAQIALQGALLFNSIYADRVWKS